MDKFLPLLVHNYWKLNNEQFIDMVINFFNSYLIWNRTINIHDKKMYLSDMQTMYLLMMKYWFKENMILPLQKLLIFWTLQWKVPIACHFYLQDYKISI